MIDDPALVSTLALVYDKIHLPHAYDLDEHAQPLMRWPGKYRDRLEHEQGLYARRKQQWAPLFEAGVLEVLPSAFATDDYPADLGQRILDELGFSVPHFNTSVVLNGTVAMTVHAMFGASKDPEYLPGKVGATDTPHLRNALVRSLFTMEVPQVAALSAADLLALRERTRNEREAFRLYMDGFVDDLERRMKDLVGDEPTAAERSVERLVIPELIEAERQLALKKRKEIVGWLGSFVKLATTTIELVMEPWKPSNYTRIPEPLLDAWEKQLDGKLTRSTNKHRAVQFISRVRAAAK